jgi:hypothetical protein
MQSELVYKDRRLSLAEAIEGVLEHRTWLLVVVADLAPKLRHGDVVGDTARRTSMSSRLGVVRNATFP